jgi:hypothetical protein
MLLLTEKAPKKFEFFGTTWYNRKLSHSASGLIYIIAEFDKGSILKKSKNRPMKIGYTKLPNRYFEGNNYFNAFGAEIKEHIVKRRYDEIRKYHYKDLYVAAVSDVIHDVKKIEKILHYLYKDNNITGEWFNLNEYDIDYMKKIFKKIDKLEENAYAEAWNINGKFGWSTNIS